MGFQFVMKGEQREEHGQWQGERGQWQRERSDGSNAETRKWSKPKE